MLNFSFSLPTRLVFGAGSLKALEDELERVGVRRPLVVTDTGVRQAGLVDAVLSALGKKAAAGAVFDAVRSNPDEQVVFDCVALCKAAGCDGFVAVGGGSVIDTAKMSAILMSNGGRPADYDGIDRFFQEPWPVVAIPTTAGTGSEVSIVASIADSERNVKMSIRHTQWGRARVAILDPSMLSSIPRRVAIAAGLDALTHNIEAFTSRQCNYIAEAFARQGMTLISTHLRRFISNPADQEAAGAMLLGSSLGAIAFSSAGTGNAHCLARVLVPALGIEHGLACALTLPHVLDYNWPANPARFREVAVALDESVKGLSDAEAAARAGAAMRGLLSDLQVPSLRELMPERPAVDIDAIAEAAVRLDYDRWNPRPTGLEGFRTILTSFLAEQGVQVLGETREG